MTGGRQLTDDEIAGIIASDECLEYLFGIRLELKMVKPEWLLLEERNLNLRFGLPFSDDDKPFGTDFTMPCF